MICASVTSDFEVRGTTVCQEMKRSILVYGSFEN